MIEILFISALCTSATPDKPATGAASERAATMPTVAVLGTVHGFHEKESFAYSYADLGEQIQRMRPTLVCGEITADDYRGEREALYPLEVAVAEEAAQAIGAVFFPSDWRPDLAAAQTTALQNEMSPEEKKAFDGVYDQFMPQLQAAGSKFFEFWHSSDTQGTIRGLHDRMIDLGTDAGAGFWDTRNQIMVKRCMRKALATRTERVLFVFGAEHKYIIEQYLRRFYGIEAQPVTRLAAHTDQSVSAAVVARWTKARDNLARLVASRALPDYLAEQFNEKYVQRLTSTIDSQLRRL